METGLHHSHMKQTHTPNPAMSGFVSPTFTQAMIVYDVAVNRDCVEMVGR